MHCPKCGTKLCLCGSCMGTDNFLLGNTDAEWFLCKGCGLKRPLIWWQTLELDVDSEINFGTDETKETEEVFRGGHEEPWGD